LYDPLFNNGIPGGDPCQPRAPYQRPWANNPVSTQPNSNYYLFATGPRYLLNADPKVNAYNQKGFSIIPYVFPKNPNLRERVGEFIYDYVKEFVGEALVPKITGMLIDLPIDEIKNYLYDYHSL
jgi:hypothetical protein